MANLITTVGKSIWAARLKGATPGQAEPNYAAIGTGAGTTAVGDTTLFTEVTTGAWAGYARIAGTSTVSANTYQVVATFTNPGTTNPIAITNAGLFDAVSAGQLFLKGDFAAVNLATNDSLQLTFQATAN